MLVIDALKWANDQLKSTDIDSPMLDAEVLLLKRWTRQNLGSFRISTSSARTSKQHFEEMVARRETHEPVAYITEKIFTAEHFL